MERLLLAAVVLICSCSCLIESSTSEVSSFAMTSPSSTMSPSATSTSVTVAPETALMTDWESTAAIVPVKVSVVVISCVCAVAGRYSTVTAFCRV